MIPPQAPPRAPFEGKEPQHRYRERHPAGDLESERIADPVFARLGVIDRTQHPYTINKVRQAGLPGQRLIAEKLAQRLTNSIRPEIVAVNLRGNAAIGANNADLQLMVETCLCRFEDKSEVARQIVHDCSVWAQEVPARK